MNEAWLLLPLQMAPTNLHLVLPLIFLPLILLPLIVPPPPLYPAVKRKGLPDLSHLGAYEAGKK